MNIVLIFYHAFIARWERYRLKQIKFAYKGYNVNILRGFKLGHTCNLYLHDNIIIGEDSFINSHGGVEIGSGTITGPNLMIFSSNHIYDTTNTIPFDNEYLCKKVTIGKNCWIGARVLICPGVTLGDGCVVAAGAAVTKGFPALSVIGGNSARQIKMRNEEKYKIAVGENVLYRDLLKNIRLK